jgi:hypothetical protein
MLKISTYVGHGALSYGVVFPKKFTNISYWPFVTSTYWNMKQIIYSISPSVTKNYFKYVELTPEKQLKQEYLLEITERPLIQQANQKHKICIVNSVACLYF